MPSKNVCLNSVLKLNILRILYAADECVGVIILIENSLFITTYCYKIFVKKNINLIFADNVFWPSMQNAKLRNKNKKDAKLIFIQI